MYAGTLDTTSENGRRLNRRAFTLVEVLCVVMIVAILAAIVLPELAPADDITVSAAARLMIGDLLYAQNQAIATQSMQFVSFTLAGSGNSGGYGLYNQQPFGSAITNPVTQRPYIVQFGSGAASQLTGVQLESLNLDGAMNTVLAFDELGQPCACTSNGVPAALARTGTIVLQCGMHTVTLSIEPDTGNITVLP